MRGDSPLLGIVVALLLLGPGPCGGMLGGLLAPSGWPWALPAELSLLLPLGLLIF